MVGLGLMVMVFVHEAVQELASVALKVIENVPAPGNVTVEAPAFGVPKTGPAGEELQVYVTAVTVFDLEALKTEPGQTGPPELIMAKVGVNVQEAQACPAGMEALGVAL